MRVAALAVLVCACAACARPAPVPPPATAANTCPSGSEQQTGTFVVEHGDPPAGGAPVVRYVLALDQARVVTLHVDDATLQPFGGATSLHGKRVTVGLLRVDEQTAQRHVCALSVL